MAAKHVLKAGNGVGSIIEIPMSKSQADSLARLLNHLGYYAVSQPAEDIPEQEPEGE